MDRVPQDFYPTPREAVIPLFNYLNPNAQQFFMAPFYGDGRLVLHIEEITKQNWICNYAADIEPRVDNVVKRDYNESIPVMEEKCRIAKENGIRRPIIIENPPWINTSASGYQLNDIIDKFSRITTTCLLLDGNYLFNKKSSPLMEYCKAVIPIGRVKWIEGSKYTGKENCAWFVFGSTPSETRLYPRPTNLKGITTDGI